MTLTASQRARHRVREEMHQKNLSQMDLVAFTGWTPSRVSKILHGKIPMTVEDLENLANAVSLPITEVIRDHGVEFCAEMTPSEMRVLDAFRALPTNEDRDAYERVLNVKRLTHERRAASHKTVSKRLSGG